MQTALAFVNDSCTSTHGYVRVDSVFLSPSGEWKLGGFDVLSNAKDEAAVLYVRGLLMTAYVLIMIPINQFNGHLLPDANLYASPEVKKEGWSVLKEYDSHFLKLYSTSDAY